MSLSAQDKIRVAVSVCGVERVHESLSEFIKAFGDKFGGEIDSNGFTVQSDGSIYHEDLGEYISDNELLYFVTWAERENA